MEPKSMPSSKEPFGIDINDLKFVVSGCWRSALHYTGIIFTRLGFNCGYGVNWALNTGFDHVGGNSRSWKKVPFPKKEIKAEGVSSTFAAPFLKEFNGIVLHQTRHPLYSVNSLLQRGYEIGYASKFVDITDIAGEKKIVDRKVAMRIYVKWHKFCENTGQQYIRYQIERLTPKMITEFCEILGEPKPISKIEEAMNIPKHIGTPKGYKMKYSWEDLPDCTDKDILHKTGIRYGYDPTTVQGEI